MNSISISKIINAIVLNILIIILIKALSSIFQSIQITISQSNRFSWGMKKCRKKLMIFKRKRINSAMF